MADAKYDDVLKQALKLSPADQLRLASALIDSVRGDLERLAGTQEKPIALIGDELRDIAANLGKPDERPRTRH